MSVAPDGSPVELYLRLPHRDEDAALIHGLLPAGGSVLDLGCGTGRLAEPLAALGHPVTGVDNEPMMLRALRRSTGVCADITALDLRGGFDAVLLMSHLVNASDPGFAAAALRTVRRHLRPAGLAIVERHPPGWVERCVETTREAGGIRYTLKDLHRDGGVLFATMRYECEGAVYSHRFSTRDVDDARLAALARRAGLSVAASIDPRGTLVMLRVAKGQRRQVQ